MRKIYVFMMVSVDGYFDDVNHDLHWHHTDDEFTEFSKQQLDATDLLLFGKITYDLMASYWPTDKGKQDDTDVATRMNAIQKIVFSTTLEKASWENTEIKHEVNLEELKKIKNLPGKDIGIFGSSNLCTSLLKLGLIDELRIGVNPIVLGKGFSIFNGLDQEVPLQLTTSKQFTNGNVLLTYNISK